MNCECSDAKYASSKFGAKCELFVLPVWLNLPATSVCCYHKIYSNARECNVLSTLTECSSGATEFTLPKVRLTESLHQIRRERSMASSVLAWVANRPSKRITLDKLKSLALFSTKVPIWSNFQVWFLASTLSVLLKEIVISTSQITNFLKRLKAYTLFFTVRKKTIVLMN